MNVYGVMSLEEQSAMIHAAGGVIVSKKSALEKQRIVTLLPNAPFHGQKAMDKVTGHKANLAFLSTNSEAIQRLLSGLYTATTSTLYSRRDINNRLQSADLPADYYFDNSGALIAIVNHFVNIKTGTRVVAVLIVPFKMGLNSHKFEPACHTKFKWFVGVKEGKLMINSVAHFASISTADGVVCFEKLEDLNLDSRIEEQGGVVLDGRDISQLSSLFGVSKNQVKASLAKAIGHDVEDPAAASVQAPVEDTVKQLVATV